MKVCLVAHSAKFYGGELSFLETLDALASSGVERTVLLPNKGLIERELRLHKVPVARIPYKFWVGRPKPRWKHVAPILVNLVLFPGVLARICLWKPDLVFSNTFHTPVGALAAVLCRRPHVWFIREFVQEDHGYSFDLRETLTRLVGRWLTHCCHSVVVANSRPVASKFRRLLGLEEIPVLG